MSLLRFDVCSIKYPIIIILLECLFQVQAVGSWIGEDHFNSGRKLMGTDNNNGASTAVYILLCIVLSCISICCRICWRNACKSEPLSEDGCDTCCQECCGSESCEEQSLTHPNQTNSNRSNANINAIPNARQPVQQQPRPNTTYVNFGNLSSAPREPNIYNRANSPPTPQHFTIIAEDGVNPQTSAAITSALHLYNFSNPPSARQLYSAPNSSHTYYNIPNIPPPIPAAVAHIPAPSINSAAVAHIPAPINSAPDVNDPPPDYASVVLGDLAREDEHTQYPSVIQK